MLKVSVTCFMASYAVAFAAELARARLGGTWSRLISLIFAAAGLIAQTIYLYARSQHTLLPPLLGSMYDWLQVLAWLAMLVYLFVALADREIAVGALVLPVVLVLLAAALFVPQTAGTAELANRNWAMLHVSLLVFGIGGILAGFVVSLLYLLQHRRLKERHTAAPTLVLPSLERLARWNRNSLLVAVPLLTLGMIIGLGLTARRAELAGSQLIWADPTVIVGLVCWTLMTFVFVWLVTRKHTPGRQVAWLTMWSCGFLLLTTLAAQVLTQATKLGTLHGGSVQGERVPGTADGGAR